jgi:hypothetical protein
VQQATRAQRSGGPEGKGAEDYRRPGTRSEQAPAGSLPTPREQSQQQLANRELAF